MSLGQKAKLIAFSFDTEDGERIQKAGLTPGEELEMVRLDPIEIKIRGYYLSLQKHEADRIKVKLLKTT